MQKFQDAEGREWVVDLNISTARSLRTNALNVDFLDYAGILAGVNDVFFAADLLFLVCEGQAKERGLDAEGFGRGLKGRALFDGVSAFVAEYLDFFPDPSTAAKMRELVDKTAEAREELARTICEASTAILNETLDDAARRLGALSSTASRSPEAASTTGEALATPTSTPSPNADD